MQIGKKNKNKKIIIKALPAPGFRRKAAVRGNNGGGEEVSGEFGEGVFFWPEIA